MSSTTIFILFALLASVNLIASLTQEERFELVDWELEMQFTTNIDDAETFSGSDVNTTRAYLADLVLGLEKQLIDNDYLLWTITNGFTNATLEVLKPLIDSDEEALFYVADAMKLRVILESDFNNPTKDEIMAFIQANYFNETQTAAPITDEILNKIKEFLMNLRPVLENEKTVIQQFLNNLIVATSIDTIYYTDYEIPSTDPKFISIIVDPYVAFKNTLLNKLNCVIPIGIEVADYLLEYVNVLMGMSVEQRQNYYNP